LALSIVEILLIGIGLSADALSVSIGNGLSMPTVRKRKAALIAFAFGFFQALMPLIGCLLGSMFAKYIRIYDHIIAWVLLGFIGGKMIYEGVKSLRADGDESSGCSGRDIGPGALLIQAIATSIDALVVGVSFAAVGFTTGGLIVAVLMIGVTTFVISFAGVIAGKKLGSLLGKRAEIIGGLILIAIGVKIFISHTFFGG
jgi:putative Mn2+ efflux pump MntP